ncbi:MAG: class I SAM-dependent RNA methyltransferase [Bryobacteraceae bacterium]
MFSWLGSGVNLIVSDFEVSIEKLVYGGDGLARLDVSASTRRVVLTPFVLPGERVRVKSEREKPGLVRARPIEVLSPAPERVEPLCPYFGRCGGCHYQHASYAAQLAAKRAILAEELWRQAKIKAPEDIAVLAAEPWGYRNRAQLHIENGKLGYREARSHKLCVVGGCPISSPKINELIPVVAKMMRDSRWPRFVRSIELFTDEQSVQLNITETDQPVARRFFDWCADTIPGLVPGALDYNGRFRVSGNSFFQVNRFLLDALVEAALEDMQGDTAFDLYAGVGLFSLPLAGRFGAVTAVESGVGPVRDLRWNAERAGAANLRAEQQTAETFLESQERSPDFVLLDPPRAGLGPEMVTQLSRLKPRAVAIVACDPVTLARDLAGLTGAGYRLERLTLVDLFPQTFHLETVARLTI